MNISETQGLQFRAAGMAILENALPAEAAEAARAQFLAADYELVDQVREHHYDHVFKTDSSYLPKGDEPYLARFRRAPALEQSGFLKDFYARQIQPITDALVGERTSEVDLRAYRMVAGDHQRIHIDQYAGKVGFIYYMSKGWKWDWGGLLLTAEGDGVTASIPKFNQLIVLDHGHQRPPHCVTPVTPFAREPRYMLVGFAR